jgi:hypothetical protein
VGGWVREVQVGCQSQWVGGVGGVQVVTLYWRHDQASSRMQQGMHSHPSTQLYLSDCDCINDSSNRDHRCYSIDLLLTRTVT